MPTKRVANQTRKCHVQRPTPNVVCPARGKCGVTRDRNAQQQSFEKCFLIRCRVFLGFVYWATLELVTFAGCRHSNAASAICVRQEGSQPSVSQATSTTDATAATTTTATTEAAATRTGLWPKLQAAATRTVGYFSPNQARAIEPYPWEPQLLDALNIYSVRSL